MNDSRIFYCPRCKCSLTMSEAMHALKLIYLSGDRSIVHAVEGRTINCANPDCQHEMSAADAISGKFDYHTGFLAGLAGIAFTVLLVVVLVRACS